MRFKNTPRPARSILLGLLSLVGTGHAQEPVGEVLKVSRDEPLLLVGYEPGRTASIAFRGTEQLIVAKGSARVKIERGAAQIDARFQDLLEPVIFGPEYTSFVLWAITSNGRVMNLGEVVIRGNRGEVKTSVPLQAFSLMVTAEPYPTISIPSNVVVLENLLDSPGSATTSTITPSLELVEQGQYAAAGLEPFDWESKLPRDLFQARNAVRIAEWQGAGRYATEQFERAQEALREAEGNEGDRDRIIRFSRQAMQLAEGARTLALQRIEEARLEQERREAAEREASAEASRLAAAEEAEWQSQLRTAAEAERRRAEAAQHAAAAEAERARKAAEEAQALLQQVNYEKQLLVAEREALRKRLLEQFRTIFETRDTARGLILNMGEVLFDVGKSDLRFEAREKLAKLSGILLGHPQLTVDVEGHTDSTGSDELNQRLSTERAEAVRTYLLNQGVAETAASARGLGSSSPIAPNDTARGRQQNRRVEIVVSGESLGDPLAGL
jgi:outer membrane protein OmpA-like peptidoglycan-associated protein